jgi:hypothetical protein
MIAKILKGSFLRPGLTLITVLAACVLGGVWLQDLRRDVFPDLSAPVFNIIVQNPAMGTEELETGVAVPMEVALAGLPDVAAFVRTRPWESPRFRWSLSRMPTTTALDSLLPSGSRKLRHNCLRERMLLCSPVSRAGSTKFMNSL